MKLGSDADYNVRVRARGWDEEAENAFLYDGMYTFDLNQTVSVSFVPAPGTERPWSLDTLPEDIADFTTPAQARLLEILTAQYSVTPDPARAGTEEQLAWPFDWAGDGDPPRPTIFYVTPEEFTRYAGDLEALSEFAGGIHSVVRRSAVTGHPVVRFLEERVLASPRLSPLSARALGRRP
ncbi:hypothetical protein [Actinoplanes flavus]|uniref:Uncharacterized protein n=1 Tax=Actinoplanes flavus TaxID=2820290 RepID=A0ABS3UG46_9ACTN|nr:hypothetical protein [Actinoplanes flavus]MBO3737757.1 hypothetical protein [Actinoplanes flavus]